MGTIGIGSLESAAGSIPLAEAFHALDQQRIDIDHHLTGLAPEDPTTCESWQELENVIKRLHEAVRGLANAPAANLADLQAKAEILATLLRSEVRGRGPSVAEAERIMLALSITRDIARLATT